MKPLRLCQGPRVKLGSAQNPEKITALSGKENTAPTKPIPQLKLHTPCCTVKSSGSQLTGKKSSNEKLCPSSWEKWQLQLLFWPQPPSIYFVNLPAMSLIDGFSKQHRVSSASRRISGKLRSTLPFKKKKNKKAKFKLENATFPHWRFGSWLSRKSFHGQSSGHSRGCKRESRPQLH